MLEELEAAFYAEAVRRGELDGELVLYVRVAGGHERTHVTTLRKVFGRQAVARPRSDFRNTTASPAAFTLTATALEKPE